MMENYLEQIREAQTEDDLNGIVDAAGTDHTITHADYSRVCSLALSRLNTL